MKISTKGRYALRMLLDLAAHANDGFVTLKEVAERQDISKKYLEQIVTLLNRTDVLQASRGVTGGYKLAKAPACYTVGEILRITEGSIAPVGCLDDGEKTCPRKAHCPTLPIWQGLNEAVTAYLDSITLQDVLDRAAQ